MAFNMNKQRGAHMDGKPPIGAEGKGAQGAQDITQETGQHHSPHIFIHSHAAGHTVHIHHPSGEHEMHEHPHGDVEGIAQHIHNHLGGGGKVASEGGPAPIEQEEFS